MGLLVVSGCSLAFMYTPPDDIDVTVKPTGRTELVFEAADGIGGLAEVVATAYWLYAGIDKNLAEATTTETVSAPLISSAVYGHHDQ